MAMSTTLPVQVSGTGDDSPAPGPLYRITALTIVSSAGAGASIQTEIERVVELRRAGGRAGVADEGAQDGDGGGDDGDGRLGGGEDDKLRGGLGEG